MDRATPTLSPGELQRLRLATQIRSHLFGVVYVLDEPSAGLHPADSEALHRALDQLRAAGNTIFVVEHDLDMMRRADWLVDVGPEAGQHGGRVLYSGPPDGLREVEAIAHARVISSIARRMRRARRDASPPDWLELEHVSRNNLHAPRCALPARRVHRGHRRLRAPASRASSARRSSTSSAAHLGTAPEADEQESDVPTVVVQTSGRIASGADAIRRLVNVDQKPIGRTPRSNLATYTGLFDHVRKLFAATKAAKARKYDAGRFSFNVAKGRCETCEGEGFVMRRAAVPAQRVRAVPHVPRRALQREDAGDRMAGARTSRRCSA